MFLARLTWPQARDYFASNDIVLIGVGSIECHGRHNPLGTDTMAPDRLGQLVDERAPELLIAPTMPYGATDDLMGFPGTVSLGVEGLTRAMTSICDSLYSYGARRFVFVNGHGGNVKSLGCVCMELNRRGCLAALFNWWRIAPQLDPAWGGGHGDGGRGGGLDVEGLLEGLDEFAQLDEGELLEGLDELVGGQLRHSGHSFLESGSCRATARRATSCTG